MLGAVPTRQTIIAERFFDEGGGMQLVVHAPFGGRINRAWGLALRKRFCRTFDFELQAAATDDGIVLSLGEQHSFPLENVFQMVRPASLEADLTQAALVAPMFGTRWRWNATRALALLRHTGGKRVPMPIQRMRAEDLLAAVFPAQLACGDNHPGGPIELPDHPLVNETIDNCLHEAMDLDGLRAVIEAIERGEVRTAVRRHARRRRRCRTRFSTPTRTPSSTTRRSKSAAPAPCRCAASIRISPAASVRSTRRRSMKCARRPGPTCVTPMSCMICC